MTPSQPLYFDNNSTTRILPEVVDAIAECLHAGYRNPASQHRSGRAARRVLEEAREQIARLLGANLAAPHQDQLIFTSGGTESNNLAIRGLVSAPGDVLVSGLEHPSALSAVDELESDAFSVVELPVSAGGHVSVESVAESLTEQTRLVVLMYGNNEVGTTQPIEEVAKVCTERGIPLHVDAVQAVGKVSIDFAKLGATSLAFSAHKFHGPRGIGGLLLRSHAQLSPLLVGGSQQLGLRPGTESIAPAVGMAKALQLAMLALDDNYDQMRRQRDELERQLINNCGCSVNGTEPRLPHTLNVSFPGLDRQALVMALDLAGVECSTGSACTSGSSEPSHVLLAMGCETDVVESSIRLSLSRLTTDSEVAEVTARISAVINGLRRQK